MGAAPHHPPSRWSAGGSPGQSLAEEKVSSVPVCSSPSLDTRLHRHAQAPVPRMLPFWFSRKSGK